MRRALAVAFFASCLPTAALAGPSGSGATHRLGFSGATITIREHGLPARLRLAAGSRQEPSPSLNLFKFASDRYLLTSSSDCIEFDPIAVLARRCISMPPCRDGKVEGATYLGRFGWMNGYEPPRGEYTLRFRFLGFEDAAEDQSCASAPSNVG
jgi:hypothetical protein